MPANDDSFWPIANFNGEEAKVATLSPKYFFFHWKKNTPKDYVGKRKKETMSSWVSLKAGMNHSENPSSNKESDKRPLQPTGRIG